MQLTDFLSEGKYLFLPGEKDPRVVLNVSSKKTAYNSFRLYNPFSRKARIFKNIVQSLYAGTNDIFKKINTKEVTEQSEFIRHLEQKLKKKIKTSLYISTVKDKYVVQLQSDENIFAYLKFPLDGRGLRHIKNEEKAIRILAKHDFFISPYLLYDQWNGKPFLLLKNEDGNIGDVEDNRILPILEKLNKQNQYSLEQHPRIKQINAQLNKTGDDHLIYILNKLIENSVEMYHEAYEHGDFAPWNIIKTQKGYVPFDFEYFEENGIEYFDVLKFYFQIGKLLNMKRGSELISFVRSKVKINEFEVVFGLFLIKEIILSKEEGTLFEFENKLLNFLKI